MRNNDNVNDEKLIILMKINEYNESNDNDNDD